MSKNLSLRFKKVPTGQPVAGEHLQVEDVGPFDVSQDAPAGGLVLETLYASFDPYLRGLMRDPSVKSYSPPFTLDGPVVAGTLSKVLKSNLDGFQEGDIINYVVPVQQYNVVTPKASDYRKPRVLQVDPDIDLRHYLGALGMPGLTAYSSLYEIGKPKKGEIIVVSSAAGAVGQVVGQLAKHEGLTVFGSVGSDDKLDFIIKELGFDGGWNYKKEKSTQAVIERLIEEKGLANKEESNLFEGGGIDIFYDNVGGEQLEGALETLNIGGRVVECGQISQYSLPPAERYGVKNTFYTVSKRLRWQGFIVSDADFGPKYAKEHQQNVTKWLKDGSFVAKIHEDVGMEKAAEALVGMLKGNNFGKAVLKIKV